MGERDDRKTGQGERAQARLKSFRFVFGTTRPGTSPNRSAEPGQTGSTASSKDRGAQECDKPHSSHKEGSVLLWPLSLLAEERQLSEKATFLHSWWLCRSVLGLKPWPVCRTMRSSNCKASVQPLHLKNTLINTTVTLSTARRLITPSHTPTASSDTRTHSFPYQEKNSSLISSTHTKLFQESFKPDTLCTLLTHRNPSRTTENNQPHKPTPITLTPSK